LITDGKIDAKKSHVIFVPSGRRVELGQTSSGHFHFIDKEIGKCQDSYSLGWQNVGSNGFCQTFAFMGAMGMCSVFTNKSKEECSIIVCQYLLDNNKKWFKKYWKRLCNKKRYHNIENLSTAEITENLNMSMVWAYGKGKSTIFWNLILDEVVYT